jgi:signal peptidase I
MGWVGRVLAWLVIFGIGATVLVAVLIPRIAGATPYVVLTGSMRPTMPPGSMVVVKPVPAQQLGIGHVITYQLESGKPTVVTHRIVSMGRFRGEPIFRTQGDANDVHDQKWVRPAQIRGVRWYAVPYLGYVTSAVSAQQRNVASIVIVAFLLGYAAYMFASAGRDRVRRRAPVTTKGGTP